MADQDELGTADRFCAYVHEAISYAHGATSIATTAAEALAGGRGVCQDSGACHDRALPGDPGCRPVTYPGTCSAKAAPTPG